MSDEIKRMDIAEFQAEGYLQEVNRQFFHPLGLALEVIIEPDDGGPARLGGIWDYRDDPEGIRYEGLDLLPKAKHVERLEIERMPARVAALGYWIQPRDAE